MPQKGGFVEEFFRHYSYVSTWLNLLVWSPIACFSLWHGYYKKDK